MQAKCNCLLAHPSGVVDGGGGLLIYKLKNCSEYIEYEAMNQNAHESHGLLID
jgi:hypothetical protein